MYFDRKVLSKWMRKRLLRSVRKILLMAKSVVGMMKMCGLAFIVH